MTLSGISGSQKIWQERVSQQTESPSKRRKPLILLG